MYEHSLLYYAVLERLEMLSDEKIEKFNSFLVSLFIFCFLNIIIRAFSRDINCTLRKRVILLEQEHAFRNMYHLQSASQNRQCNNNYSRRLPVLRTRSVSGVIALFVYFITARYAVTQRLTCDVIVSSAVCSPSYF